MLMISFRVPPMLRPSHGRMVPRTTRLYRRDSPRALSGLVVRLSRGLWTRRFPLMLEFLIMRQTFMSKAECRAPLGRCHSLVGLCLGLPLAEGLYTAGTRVIGFDIKQTRCSISSFDSQHANNATRGQRSPSSLAVDIIRACSAFKREWSHE